MQKKICNVCGKEFDMWDEQEGFGFDYYVGYGSKHDCEHLQADICCDCFDSLMDKFIPFCKHSPIVGEVDFAAQYGTLVPMPTDKVIALRPANNNTYGGSNEQA